MNTTTTARVDAVAGARAMALVLDSAFQVPGTRLRVGLDAILGLLPVAGDLIGALAGSYIVMTAAKAGVPKPVLARMAFNVGIDTLLGSVPLVGDLFDVGWKANTRNVALLERSLADPAAARRSSSWFLAGLVLVLVLAVAGVTALVLWLAGLIKS
jgi:hypothetical protein